MGTGAVNRRTLLSYHDLTVEVETTPGEELIDHLHSTVLGQPGGFRYQHTNVGDRLFDRGDNYFMYLRKSGKMIGSVGFCGKRGSAGNEPCDLWLIRYFSIKAPIRRLPTSRKKRSGNGEESRRTSVLYRFITPIFENPSQLRDGEEDGENQAIIYAIIDQTNLRSMNFSEQMGMETISEMIGFTFSRFRPKRSQRVEQLGAAAQGEMLGLLKEYYSKYNLFYTDPLFRNGDYYVNRQNGTIVAGVQVYRVTWRVLDFGGGLASRLLRMLTGIPWFRKRIDPENLRLLAFDAIYCAEGHEEDLYVLLEGVLERTGVYVGMLMMDMNAPIYRAFNQKSKLGPINRILGDYRADIRMRFLNLASETITAFKRNPTYVPTYDNS